MRAASWIAVLACLLLFADGGTFAQTTITKGGAADVVKPEPNPTGTIHVLAIGWDDYSAASSILDGEARIKDLRFAKKDATDLAALLGDQYGARVELGSEMLFTRQALMDRLTALATTGEVRPTDVFILYIAGHGDSINVPGQLVSQVGFVIPPRASLKGEYESALKALIAADKKPETTQAAAPAADDKASKPVVGQSTDAVKMPAPAAPSDQHQERLDEIARIRALEQRAFELTRTAEVYERAGCIRADELRAKVLAIPAMHTLVILDTCFSGFAAIEARDVVDPAGVKNASDLVKYILLTNSSQTVITAGTANQKSIEPAQASGQIQNGVFTHSLLKALRNAPDAVASSQVFELVYDETVTLSRAMGGERYQMTPQRRQFGAGSGDLVLVRKPPDLDNWLMRVAKAKIDEKKKPVIARVSDRSISASATRQRESASLDMLLGADAASKIQSGRAMDPKQYQDQRWLDWFLRNEKLAAQGNPSAMVSLYYAHAYGIGTERDPHKARYWAEQARNTGDQVGSAALADSFAKGNGVNIDAALAEQARLEAQQRQTVFGGPLLIGASAQQGNDAGIFAGMIATFVAIANFDSTKPESMALRLRGSRDAMVELASQPQSADRDAKLEKAILGVQSDLKKIGDTAAAWKVDGAFKRLGYEVVSSRSATVGDALKAIKGADLHGKIQRLDETVDLVMVLIATEFAKKD